MSVRLSQRSSTLAGYHSDDSAARRTTSFGTGIRFIPVEHEGNRSASLEDVARDWQTPHHEHAPRLIHGRRWKTARELREQGTSRLLLPTMLRWRRLREGAPSGVRVRYC